MDEEEYVPAGQSSQVGEPDEENLPGVQDVHSEDLALEDLPELHGMHVANDVAPSVAEYFPAGQDVQLAAAVAPRRAEKLPAGQNVQEADDVAPGTEENFPASHGMQEDSSGAR